MSIDTLTLPIVDTLFESDTIIPGNIAISHDGRIFISVNPMNNPLTKLFELLNYNEATPFPDSEYASGSDSIIKGALGINVDEHHRLWILDMEGRQFFVWDLETHTLQERFAIDGWVTRPNSFLQDFVIDERRGRIFIADMTLENLDYEASPAIIMIDMVTHEMSRLLESHSTLHPDLGGTFGLNPIAIDPACEWLYFGALHGRKLYRVPLDAFDEDAIDALEDTIELFGEKSYCDGIVVDDRENVYITNVEERTLAICNRDGFRNIAELPKGQSWPDGLALHGGYLYATLSQLDRSAALNEGVDSMVKPYMVVMTPLQ